MAGKKIKIKSALPYYALGAVWIFYSLFFRLYRPADLILCLGVSLIVFIVVSRFAPVKTIVVEEVDFGKSGDDYADEIISKGRAMLQELYGLKGRMAKEELEGHIGQMYETGEKIYGYVAKHPKKATIIRQFNLYYFPETLKILNAYVNLRDIRSDGENLGAALDKIEKTAASMTGVFKKQLDTLLHDEVFDVQTDIEVLEMLVREEGLQTGGTQK